MSTWGGNPGDAQDGARDAGTILPQNSVHSPMKNVQTSGILLLARDPGNRASASGAENRSDACRLPSCPRNRGTIFNHPIGS
ncbi:TPA: hypothetical protein SAP37_004980 [Burkholderia multivorans]|nr:hypothetical protein [Burkholderia multivorans]HEF4827148.1 hypothetical protein [Burkholderia multivorans]